MLSTSHIQEARQLYNYILNAIWLKSKFIWFLCGSRISRHEIRRVERGRSEQIKELKTRSEKGGSLWQVAEVKRPGKVERSTTTEMKDCQKIEKDWKETQGVLESGERNEWREQGKYKKSQMKKKEKEKKKQRNKKRLRKSKKVRRGKHFQSAFQSIIISWVLDMRERESAILQWLSLSSQL